MRGLSHPQRPRFWDCSASCILHTANRSLENEQKDIITILWDDKGMQRTFWIVRCL